MTSNMDQMFADTKFIVEANHNEVTSLWCKHSKEGRPWGPRTEGNYNNLDWEQIPVGWHIEVGQLAGYPVCVSFQWFRLNGVLVMAYEAVSRVVDHQIVGDWIEARCNPKWAGGTRNARTNAGNFHCVVEYVLNPERR